MSRKEDMDNHANQLNPNNDAYWESRGYDERSDNWEEEIEEEDSQQERNKAERDPSITTTGYMKVLLKLPLRLRSASYRSFGPIHCYVQQPITNYLIG